MPALVASRKNVSKKAVREAKKLTIDFIRTGSSGTASTISAGSSGAPDPVPLPVADGVEEHPRERIADQRIVALGFRRTRRRHAERRRAHAFGDLPAVVIGSHDTRPYVSQV